MSTARHSRRDARRAHIEQRERKLRHLQEEGAEIFNKFLSRWNRENLIPLEKPLFLGYKREHVVRADIARSPDAEYARLALKYIGRTVYCRNREFTRKNRKTKKTEAIPHDLCGISDSGWKRLKLDEVLPERLRRLFRPCLEKHSATPHSATQAARYEKVYRFTKPWWFDTKISRHYATHVRPAHGEYESAYKRIQNRLEAENWFAEKYGRGGRDEWGIKQHRFWQDPLKADHWERYTENL